jgi:hypothetical protein
MAIPNDYSTMGNWAVMLNPDANIDRHGHKRTVQMEVLSLGFPRTATLSMSEALQILGCQNPYHYVDVFKNVKDADMWQEALAWKSEKREDVDWRRHFNSLLGHCAAVTDVPSITMWRELIEAYPEAKVVLVERDEDKWFRSFETLVEGILNPLGRYILRFTDPLWFGRISNLGAGWVQVMFGTKDLTQIKKDARSVYRSHYAAVRATVPKENLLEYQLGSGWEPLCKFLEKPVPSVAFPHRNEANALQQAFGILIGKALKHSAMNAALVVAVGAVLFALRNHWP